MIIMEMKIDKFLVMGDQEEDLDVSDVEDFLLEL
ncbi:hypothetical protein SDC9_196486 [bioreactor metagenome]|uniref:Uncharacterized protein n=1 Tax=bioreactor metagenome TaxID=1076179 RepID=A0A645IKN2_9ZZZZ